MVDPALRWMSAWTPCLEDRGWFASSRTSENAKWLTTRGKARQKRAGQETIRRMNGALEAFCQGNAIIRSAPLRSRFGAEYGPIRKTGSEPRRRGVDIVTISSRQPTRRGCEKPCGLRPLRGRCRGRRLARDAGADSHRCLRGSGRGRDRNRRL